MTILPVALQKQNFLFCLSFAAECIYSIFQVITELLAGDQVNVVATGDSYYEGHGYTTFTGFQLRTGLA